MSNQCLGLGAPGRNTTGGTDIPHVVKRSGAKFREEFILRPDRVQMAPVNVISVAVVASDPLTRDGALARLSSHRELDVRAWQAGCETSVLLVLATTITAPLLCQIEDVQKDGPSHAPKLVVVADEFSAEQVFRMIKLGLTGLLYRSQSTFDCIVETIRLSAEGRLRLPERVQRYLVGRIKSTPTAEPDTPCAAALAEREVAVLRLLADGLSTHQVAVQLNYCERTIKNIVHDIVTRLNAPQPHACRRTCAARGPHLIDGRRPTYVRPGRSQASGVTCTVAIMYSNIHMPRMERRCKVHANGWWSRPRC